MLERLWQEIPWQTSPGWRLQGAAAWAGTTVYLLLLLELFTPMCPHSCYLYSLKEQNFLLLIIKKYFGEEK